MIDNSTFLEYKAFLDKYSLNCTSREFIKICNVIPVPLLQIVRGTMLYARTRPIPTLPNLVINDCILFDSKCNNRFINDAFK